MKKLFISIIAVALSLSAMAASTAAARIKLVGSNATYAVNTVFLNEDDARNSSYESGYDAESMMSLSNPFSVLIYAYVGEHPCEFVATDNLDGLAISFTTNMVDASYTLQFSNVSGRALKLYDRLLDVETDITEGGSYPFSVDGSLVGQQAVNDRFYINLDADDFAYQLTTNDYGWASYSNSVDLVPTSPAGLKIYTGAFDGADALNLTVVDYVKADEGVVVYGAANTTYYFAAGTGASVYGTNHLKPASAFTPGDANVFVLKGNALYEYVGTDPIPANKAYLQLPGGPGAAPKRISFKFGEAQGVQNVVASDKAEKFMENGQMLIKRGDKVFNMQGQEIK